MRKSGVTDKALQVGDRAPDFELPNAAGKKVKLSELTTRGPVIVTWYRGGLVPLLQHRPPRLPQIVAGDQSWCHPGRPLA